MAETEIVDKKIVWTTPPQFKTNVLIGQAATVALTAAQSGSTCVFDSAAGIVYTLPAAAVGLTFNFAVTVTITSGAAKVITKTIASEFMAGGVINAGPDTPGAGPGPKQFPADGTSHVSISMNGTTTGGAKGTSFTLTCVSSTLWVCTNGCVASITSQTIANPFATS